MDTTSTKSAPTFDEVKKMMDKIKKVHRAGPMVHVEVQGHDFVMLQGCAEVLADDNLLEEVGCDVSIILGGCFPWKDTPQGHQFWKDESEAEKISEEGKEALRSYIGGVSNVLLDPSPAS